VSDRANIAAGPPAADHDIFCPFCGYNLRGITSAKCPECGQDVDRSQLLVSRIPWEHRRQIGRIRAYLRTAMMALFSPGKLGEEVARPVSYRDAQKFRWVTVGIAWFILTSLLVTMDWDGATRDVGEAMWYYFVYPSFVDWSNPPWLADAILPWTYGVMAWVVVPSALLFLGLATGILTPFLRRRALSEVQRNRAVAIGRYCCAPWPFLAAGLLGLSIVGRNKVHSALGPELGVVSLLLVGLLLLAAALLMWLVPTATLKGATRCTGARLVAWVVLAPAMLALAAIYAFVLMPWVVGFVRLAIASWS
jgi:hypothetical protein